MICRSSNRRRRRAGFPGGALFLSAAILLSAGCEGFGGGAREENGPGGIIGGVVRADDGPVAGAVVRVQTTDHAVTTGRDGRFLLRGLPRRGRVSLTVWAPGYYITGGVLFPVGERDVSFKLEPYPEEDHPDYEWLPSGFTEGKGEDQGCAECHSSSGTSFPDPLPVDEWRRDAHSGSPSNPRFVSMYTGTSNGGEGGSPTPYVHQKDYGTIPVPPAEDETYRGPGYKLDFPDSDGNCGSCHVPIAALDDPYGVDPRRVSGTAAEGISCDFCHKAYDVVTEPETGLPHPNRPGVLSMEFRRPGEGHQIFFGPLDDVAPGEDSYLPFQEQSRFCAACHHGVFWDVTVYNSYGEWLESPYSDPITGRSCQECHMPVRGHSYFALPDKGGLKRRSETLRSHLMTGATDRELLQNSLTMEVAPERKNGTLHLRVLLVNDLTGHHVPTGTPLRHMILVVSAADADGTPLNLLEGPRLPEWTGRDTGAAAFPDIPGVNPYAGRPGKVYAKVLEEHWTGTVPTGAYWNQTRLISDNRIPAFGEDESAYVFAAPPGGRVNVEVRLLYRRGFYDLMRRKGWKTPDILMEEYAETIQAE